MKLETVKRYLRIDFTDDDQTLSHLITVAEAYLVGAVDNYTEKYVASQQFAAAADMAMLAIIADLYDNRNFAGKRAVDYSFVIRSLITQLQCTEV